ncbi:MAG: 3-deoxy-manno-octulosonate cytidylyltransferase [Candidatus Marinimicrobia bacterium]|jgi:3-deoxy-manno-octulosonate cytidylyltransferase (CMP-KDO synthetase)|nr:3-deoxy-manno-octulosonate cytidylyltransferase [Candidatus Neomarinimicrobiota bacterium]MBT3945322.1 3-deoxy-manno-octulosonate cytidylyltransferase [Candidatus Neomarinimicrobiota bacterium]MBT4155657.1 3-deoxy-manno-octulosonate cytidylyltransferase [Candidatus Neomarinimicrobiota bacterium]MBT4555003.1 3-deoxy-manno-octulosonate cytidylyltransferase [Candidatus Neomarinimicrobiota bacterium]MBT4752065.1 3-deoxy-manno-octulosonate cytidylyltransferase [Candidatus Neomarinimicrobiota bact|tara:strand:- start:4308 stop:5042 length:735 start_codon:yes stop_codon:yes gene_type:complete
MIVGVIPARIASTRFPKKILAPLAGKPMVVHVVTQALKSKKLDKVILAIDSEETRDALAEYDIEMVMTSQEHQSGTDRVAEVIKEIDDVEIIINLQGDEPLVDPNVIDGLVDTFKDTTVHMATVVSRKLRVADLLNPNIVKAILDENMNTIEFKRNIFDLEIGGIYRHIGMYGFRRNALFQFTILKQSERELERSLEQMRALDHGLPIRAMIANCDQWAVDTKEDLEKVAELMGESKEPIEQDA